MNLCFKAFATTELPDESLNYRSVYWSHPREITDESLIEDIVHNLYLIAADECYEHGIEHDHITVVTYHADGTAYLSTDFDRKYPGSVDRWYGDDIADKIARL